MDKQTIASGPNPEVVVETDGDLTLKGWDEPEVLAKSDSPEDLTVEQRDDEVHIRCRADCVVRVPIEATVQIERVSGHAVLKALEGETTIHRVDGHLTLRNVGATTISRVHGHLAARNVEGDLNVTAVDGNATLRNLEGDFLVEDAVNGNLVLKEIDGNARAAAHGNLKVALDPSPGTHYNFMAGGNLICRLPEDASARISVQKGSQIVVKFPGVETGPRLAAPYELILGEGDAELTLSADGNVILSSLPPDWDFNELEVEIGEDISGLSGILSEQIARQVEVQMEYLEEQLESQLENLSSRLGDVGLSAEQAARIAERAKEAGERARQRAEERIQRAQEKMKRKLEAARRRAEMKARAAERAARDRRKRAAPPAWPPTPKQPVEPVSEEERLMILQMLEQGKITTEEAEQLLAALEGKSP
jgi:hypothetical protein